MLQNFTLSLLRRRRFLLLKFIALFVIVGTLLIWTSVRKTDGDFESHNHKGKHEELMGVKVLPHLNENYQKAVDNPLDFPNYAQDDNNNVPGKKHAGNHLEKPLHNNNNANNIQRLRESVKAENRDEFLIPVLKDYEFVEVDLSSKKTSHYDDYDEEIEDDLKKIKPDLGANGDKAEVPAYQKAVAEEIQKKEAFNRLLSEYISPNRSVPDTREKGCRSVQYDDNLPTTSVIIIYTNEAFTSLVRTLHSVVNRTPKHLLSEIILVDDFSDHRDLKGKLERYIATKLPVDVIRLVRLKSRAGLIRARMIGAHLAVGDVLIFLDAHCETVQQWAEPLLQRIKEERTAVVCPIIDVIDDKTMEYYHSNGEFFQIGGFTWSGHFTWINIPHYESVRKDNHYSPTRSPTMAGGLFAIDRKYFWEIGSYDSGMQLWGGENLELSFRIWQCGGSVEIVPCSRVGHIFRNFHPYSFPGNVDSHGLNTARLAVVWMDEFKDLFFAHRAELKDANFGDVSKRITFRKRMKCKSFKWFLDNIYKEKFQLQFDSRAYGQVKNVATNQCFDNMQMSDSDEYNLSVYPCHDKLYSSQTFFLSNKSHLRRENECASHAAGQAVRMVQCDNTNQIDSWEYKDSQLVNKKSGKCLTLEKEAGQYKVVLRTCAASSKQLWTFDTFDKHGGREES